MPHICLYLHLHQPNRLQPFSIFDVGRAQPYFSQIHRDENRTVFEKVAHKSYLPMLQLLEHLLKKEPTFCFALSLSGVFLDQATAYTPQVITVLQRLVKTGRVEIIAETYYHSLASLYSKDEFFAQIALHEDKIREVFDVRPTVFRNTELIYSNHIAQMISELPYRGILTEAVPRYLHGRPKTQVFASNTDPKIPLLLKHAELSDDIAFRFSDKNWHSYPLTADTYIQWLYSYRCEQIINLFMDFETFGEHQWEDTGIFQFFERVVTQSMRNPWTSWNTPTQLVNSVTNLKQLPVYDVPDPISWADVDRDITAWRGNGLQWDTLRLIYEMEKTVLATQDQQIINDWRSLQTSDHFYYMCIKWSADGDVHAYFSPYDSPLDAYNRYTTVLADFRGRLNSILDT